MRDLFHNQRLWVPCVGFALMPLFLPRAVETLARHLDHAGSRRPGQELEAVSVPRVLPGVPDALVVSASGPAARPDGL